MKMFAKSLCSLSLLAAVSMASNPALATVDTLGAIDLKAELVAIIPSLIPPGSPLPSAADINKAIDDFLAGTADPQTAAFIGAAKNSITQSAGLDPLALFLGFISTFAFSDKIIPDNQSNLSTTSTEFIAALINPDPLMAFHLSFHNTSAEDAILTMVLASDISPVLTFADNPVVNATVEATVTDLGGAQGATADVAVDFFTIEGGFNVSTGLFFNDTVTDTAPGSFAAGPTPRLSFDPITGFQTSVLATIAPGDLLDLKVTFGIGSDGIPLVDNAVAQQALADGMAAAIAAGEQEPEPVPVPAAGILMLAGIAGLGALKARRRPQ